ncbi:MAG: MFS transporter [Chloroflexi bacterium]|nr:MFS transporter [Chloroflexota bacterium]
MQLWALYWHLRTLSDQPMVISGIGLVRFLPVILLSLVAGVAADRFDRRKMAILTQVALGLVALFLGLTTAWGIVTLWMIFGLVIMQSVAVAFDGPARQALIPSLVPRENLANAYSLTSIASKVGGILGPAICGVVIAFLGLQWAYWINAISYLAVIAALIAMGDIRTVIEKKTFELRGSPGSRTGRGSPGSRTGRGSPGSSTGRGTLRDIRAGIEFIKNSPIIFSVMVLDFFGTFFSSANTLLPFVAMDILHVGPIQYGWLSASQSIGTMFVGLYLSQKTNLRRQGLLISISVAGFGLATVLFGVSTSFWLTMLALILIGAFDGLSSIIRNTARQLLTPDAMRGRMMSITQIFFKGGPQLGEVESGLVAQILGVPFAIISGGVGCVLAACIVVKRIPQLWNYNGDEALQEDQVS